MEMNQKYTVKCPKWALAIMYGLLSVMCDGALCRVYGMMNMHDDVMYDA